MHSSALHSGCGESPTKTLGLLKPPWMSPRGQWSGRNAGLGLEVQGYVLLLMRSPRWASLARSPDTASPAPPKQPPPATKTDDGPLKDTALPEQSAHPSVPLRLTTRCVSNLQKQKVTESAMSCKNGLYNAVKSVHASLRRLTCGC